MPNWYKSVSTYTFNEMNVDVWRIVDATGNGSPNYILADSKNNTGPSLLDPEVALEDKTPNESQPRSDFIAWLSGKDGIKPEDANWFLCDKNSPDKTLYEVKTEYVDYDKTKDRIWEIENKYGEHQDYVKEAKESIQPDIEPKLQTLIRPADGEVELALHILYSQAEALEQKQEPHVQEVQEDRTQETNTAEQAQEQSTEQNVEQQSADQEFAVLDFSFDDY